MEGDYYVRVMQPALTKCKECMLYDVNCLYRYSLMKTCWEESAVSRPHFNELFKSIDALVKPLAGYIDLNIIN